VYNSRLTILVLFVVFALAASAHAAESSWKLPNLNPFAKKTTSEPSYRVSDQPKSGWQMPKLPKVNLPKVNLKPPKINLVPKWARSKTTRPSQPTGPSTWDKLVDGTKNFLGKTKETLTSPFKNSSTRASRPTSSYPSARSKKPPERQPLFAGWLTPKKEEPKPRMAPHEFLKQPRPEF